MCGKSTHVSRCPTTNTTSAERNMNRYPSMCGDSLSQWMTLMSQCHVFWLITMNNNWLYLRLNNGLIKYAAYQPSSTKACRNCARCHQGSTPQTWCICDASNYQAQSMREKTGKRFRSQGEGEVTCCPYSEQAKQITVSIFWRQAHIRESSGAYEWS